MGILDGRVAVVTGSGRGIGREFALSMAREGANIVINDVGVSLDGQGTDEDPAAQTVKDIKALGVGAIASYGSVTDYDAAGQTIQAAIDEFGQIDILINNAGIVRDRSLVKMGPEDFDAVVKVHMYGTFNMAQHAAGHMKEAGYGRIINVTSQAGLRGNFGQTNYGAAKAAIMGMTFIWSIELGKYGVTVNAMSPAGATRMTSALFERTGTAPPPETDPALNAPNVTWIASDQAGHVNGQILGRTDFAYTIYQHPKQVAYMYEEGGMDVATVGENFDKILGQHLQHVGMSMPGGMEHKK
jgi:NAD(P)-dependent dehydrogenase (short-subunit alcohol dehydrogenase family)